MAMMNVLSERQFPRQWNFCNPPNNNNLTRGKKAKNEWQRHYHLGRATDAKV
jgi:hypothetical protein